MRTYKPWTAEDDAILLSMYSTVKTTDIQLRYLPHRKRHDLVCRAKILGISKLGIGRETRNKVTSVIGHLTELEKGYLAGIIDGEGCIHMSKLSKIRSHYISITISTSSPNLREWILSKLGGKVYMQPRRAPNRKDMWSWSISTHKATILCKEISPYLIIKRRQAELVGSGFIDLNPESRLHMYNTLKMMKQTD